MLTTAPAATAWPSQSPPTARATVGSDPVVHWLHSSTPVASDAPIGSRYAAASTGSATNDATRNARSGARVSPSTVVGVSQPA